MNDERDDINELMLDAQKIDLVTCACCGSEVNKSWIVQDGRYKGQCTDCANENANDDERSSFEDGN